MDQDLINWLCSPEGSAILADLAIRDIREVTILSELNRLRRSLPVAHARAAIEQALLRRRAISKFPQADRMLFTREALEQASAATVATHRTRRLAQTDDVADLGCGIGGDTIALADAGAQVIAVERDPIRLALARFNAEVLGLGSRVSFVERDLIRELPPSAAALFCDPSRRRGERRLFDPDAFQPPLTQVLSWRQHTPALVVKLAPGIQRSVVPEDAEVEFVSLDGDLKEAVLWCGPFATTDRRATVLGSDGSTSTMIATATTAPSLSPPLAVIYEPDPAVIRAGLVAELAHQLGAYQLAPDIAYLTAHTALPTPFARAWPIITWMPFQLKRLRALVRELDAGVVTVKKRGSPLDTDSLARQLSGSGQRHLVVVLTQMPDGPIAIICSADRADMVT
ncbi:THUMP-like domain-containing protein [Chloroflexus sp.]|uniref:THUMP-like domain-containing protein n=1 Tax=Chloroflexus sp. TaxID=1904827 RepID=UPI002ADE0D7E|nr:methyltransferase domain-containing protein [Chloroflexus sp.]